MLKRVLQGCLGRVRDRDFKGDAAKVKALVSSLNKMGRDVPVDTDTVGRKLSNMKRSLTGKDGDAKRVKLEAEAKKLQA